VWAQIERGEAVERAREIAAVPGIDALVVGTADLSFSLGTPLDLCAPPLLAAIEAVCNAAEAEGVSFGVAGALDALPTELRARASILVHSTDARLCASAVDGTAAWMRGDA
jgi:2-keto-3-deoxy-L-rhamnonate aldolase RhmA